MRTVGQTFIVVVICAILIRVFVLDSFILKGDSMAPTLRNNDYIFVGKLSYRLHSPQREDIVVTSIPSNPSKKIIKRIIGLPGERISIAQGKITIKNSREDAGTALEESYLTNLLIPTDVGITNINLDPQEYFVLGDNRSISIDSRELGPINSWNIKGKVIFDFTLDNFSFKRF